MGKIFLALLCSLLLYSSAFSQEAEQFDAFGSNINCEDYLTRMDSVINQAQTNPLVTIYVLIYEGRQSSYNYKSEKTTFSSPPVGLGKAQIRSMKAYIGNFRNFPVERFKFVEAGFREDSMVELWLVPNGAEQPKLTPTLTKMKYRKGKAYGFCLGCCG